MPDVDIVFCQDRREEVIRYVQEKYGRDQVAQIITFGSLQARAALRDVGRVLQMPYGMVDRICKLVPNNPANPTPLDKAIEDEPRFAEEIEKEPAVAGLLDIAQKIEGLYRHASTHAAGIVIGDRPLSELVPMYRDPRSDMPVTQFNMKWVEQAGLVKFDFLGLKTLTVLKTAVDFIARRGVEIDLSALPRADPPTYAMLSRGETVGVFQVESAGMRKALIGMKPDRIEDIIALVALYRPGPMENIPVYNARKHGEEELASIHPKIDYLLAETQGVIVYQEQVMQIAQVMAGYSLGGADLLRRAMGKKIKEAMDAERPKFEKGAAENGVDKKKASEVFDLLEKFANYGFNKSHAAAYAVVSYQTAWLKANHPVEFMGGVMNCDIHLTDKLAVYFEEVKKGLGLPYVPPCVNRSEATFNVVNGELVYALGALKNVGLEAMKLVTDARRADGADKPFVNIFDFARRVDLKKVGKRPLEMMARAGAFDQLDPNRRRIFESLEALIGYSAAIFEQKNSNQVSLFGEAGDDLPEPRLASMPDWLPAERLSEEFKAIGFYLSGHPLDDYMPALKRKQVMTLDEVAARAERGPHLAKMAGVVAGRQERKSARGNRFAFAQLSDTTGAYEVTLFSEVLEKSREFLETGAKVVLTAEATMESDQLKLLVRSVGPIDATVADAGSSCLRVYINDAAAIGTVASVLEDAKQAARNASRGEVLMYLQDPTLPGDVELDLGQPFPVNPQIKGALKSLEGVLDVEEI